MAAAVSTQFSIVSGGVACAIGALAVALLLPGFRRYSQRPDGSCPTRPTTWRGATDVQKDVRASKERWGGEPRLGIRERRRCARLWTRASWTVSR